MPRARNYGIVRQQAAAMPRTTRIIEMWALQKMTYQQIADVEGITKGRVGQIVRAGLARWRREQDELVHLGAVRELHEIDVVAREAYTALTRACPRCHGHGTRNGAVCDNCAGSGHWYASDERRRWATQLLRAADARARLLGHNAPQDHRLLGGDGEALAIRDILVRMAPDEVAREAEWFLAGAAHAAETATATESEGGSGS